jgi:hypothetical protein
MRRPNLDHRFVPLKRALGDAGWSIEQVDPPSDGWWAYEIWRLTSTWSPAGRAIHLSLLIDPALDAGGSQAPETLVWAAALSEAVPADRLDAERTSVRPGPNFPAQVAKIVAAAAALRASGKA